MTPDLQTIDLEPLKPDEEEKAIVEPKAGTVAGNILFHNETAIFKQKLEHDKTKHGLLGFKLNRFKRIETTLDGLQTGLYLVGGRENSGKTAFILNLFLDTLQSNEDIFCLYISLDDNTNIIRNRALSILSKGELSINQVAKPNSLKNHYLNNTETNKSTENIEHYNNATEQYLKLSDRFNIIGSEDIEHIEQLENKLHSINQKGKIVVFIDAIYNLNLQNENGDNRLNHIRRANKLKELVKTFDIPLIGTVELVKNTDKKPNEQPHEPTTSDIMESGKYAYNADLVLMLWYDKKDIEKMKKDSKEKLYINITYAKNKLSDFKSKYIADFKRNSSLYTLLSEKEQKALKDSSAGNGSTQETDKQAVNKTVTKDPTKQRSI